MSVQKTCPFCGSNKLKFESKNNNRGMRLDDKYAGYKSKHTGSIRCNKCHARGPTVSILVKDTIIGEINREKLISMAYSAWNDRV